MRRADLGGDLLPTEADPVKVVCGDALEVLPSLPAACVDLVLTDPPFFGVKADEWDNQWATAAEYLGWLGGVLGEFRRVMKPNGSLYVFASPQMSARVETLVGESFRVLNNLRWKKEDGWARRQCKEEQRAYFPASEAVVFAEQYGSDGEADDAAGYGEKCDELHKRVYAPIGAQVKHKREAAGLQRHEVDTACAPSRKPTGLCYRWEAGDCLPTPGQFLALCRLCGDDRDDESLRREYESLRREYESLRREYESLRRPFFMTDALPYSDVWDYPTVNTYPGKHPCEKPLRMFRDIVKVSSRPGDLVLDGFAGSGTAGVAAAFEGRRALLVERDPKYHALAVQRVEKALGKSGLFAEVTP
jgi:adenine-specific DNA-methyltransferase